MRNKIDLARKVVKNAPVAKKITRPTRQYYQQYEPSPEELDDEGYDNSDELNESYRQQQENENNERRNRIADDLRTLDSLKEQIKNKGKIATKQKFLILLKNPIVIKIIIILFIIILVIIIIAIIVSAISGGGVSDHTVLKEQCPIVTVTYTGCDLDGKNCNHQYDGEVSFEDYIAGVIAAEEPYYINAIRLRIEELIEMGVISEADREKEFKKMAIEYYKMQAIIVRTNTLSHMTFTCEVEGNDTFQKYIDVDDSENSNLIKQAVEENKGQILTEIDKYEDEYLLRGDYSSACVVNADSSYYYVRYGRKTHKEPQIQKIPKDWASKYGIDSTLHNLYYNTPKSDIVYEQPACPKGTSDYGITKIGTLYLFLEEYAQEDILNYYFDEELQIQEIETKTSETVNGFTNPTSTISCSSPYGNRTHPVTGVSSYHSGIDIAIAGGSPVYATKGGTITTATSNITAINSYCSMSNSLLTYGNYVVIQHDDGTSSLYAHMKYGSIPSSITVGKRVEQGTQIGQVGSTGCSTGNHLHYEVRQNGTRVDPANYLDLSSATGACRR